ncbi:MULTISPECIES: hypothetical protein [Ferrimonas]|uniref:hypothetical protein n=1 Tax=Ferrimonas TaxID=44011 RepID=UPI000412488D|nr:MULTISPECIES: hypothetical protein [Ferrimonas]USD38117.1 hypothetical protein J8Z22_02840 [Ferrimonas sp. SCSIO 43195]
MTELDPRYRIMRAADDAHFHTCFYCGCIATDSDFAPPRDHWYAFADHQQAADNLQVPACKECLTLLKGCTMGLLLQRRDVVQAKLANKYKQAINVYLRWNQDEVAQLDRSLSHSIAAGLTLGEEAHRRSQYPGYAYELEGSRIEVTQLQPQPVRVFGERFDSLKAALVYASRTYGIKQGQLAEALAKHNHNLDAAILAFQQQQKQQLSERELNRHCAAFAKQHGQSRRYVVNAVHRYLDRDETLTVAEALDKLYQERIQHFLKSP